MSKAALHTLGCRLNQAETEIIGKRLQNSGYEIVEWGQASDLTVINTCTVTEQADAKCRQAIRQSQRQNPATRIAVIGCYAQMDVPAIRKIPGVSLIIGNEHKLQITEFLDQLDVASEPVVVHTSKISRDEFVIDAIGLYDTQTRANLKIQDGCSFVCSFCIIAAARGPARSRNFEDILKEAGKLIDLGFREIVLTGVNIGTYSNNGQNFTGLLRKLAVLPGLQRLRISSIEPTTVTRELIDSIAEYPALCRHLHIPLQSGNDEVLEKMRRKHTIGEFREIVEYAAQTIPGVGLGTDIMVGFPGESREAFDDTRKFLADLPIPFYHVFSYSDRKGTASHKLQPKIDHQEKKLRNHILTEQGRRQKRRFQLDWLNQPLDVLFEEEENGWWSGFTDNYLRVRIKQEQELKNQVHSVRITGITDEELSGELL